MAKKELFTIELNGEQYLQIAQRLKKQILELNLAQKEMKGTAKEASSSFIQNQADLKTLKKEYLDVEKAIQSYNKEQIRTSEKTKQVNSEMEKEINTINKANQQITRLNKIKKDLNVNNKKEKQLLDDINKRIDKNTKFVKENSSEAEKQKMNIGNYVGVLDGISPRLSGWVRQGIKTINVLKKQKQALVAMNTTTKTSSAVTNASSKSLRLFKIALISTGIGAIVVALGLLIGAFLKTQKGIDKVTRVLTPLKTIFQSLIGVAQEVGEKLFNTFKNPEKAVKKLWQVIKTNLVNRITAIGGIFKSLGKIISSGFTDGYKDFANATLQLTTGVEDVVGKISDATKKTGEFFSEANKRGKEIADLSILISKKESEIALKRERTLNLIREQELITKDKSKSQAEINKALATQEKLTKQLVDNDNEIIKLKIKKTKLENKSNDTNREDLTKLNELEAQLETNKNKARGVELRFLGVKNRMNAEINAKIIAQGKKQLEIEKQKLNEAVKNADIELQIYIQKNKDKLNSENFLNAKILEGKLQTLKYIFNEEKKQLEFKLANGLIKQNEFNLKKLELENEYNSQVKEVNDIANQQKLDEDLRVLQEQRKQKQIDFELQLEQNSLNDQTEYERKKEAEQLQYENDKLILEQKLQDELLTREQYILALANIDKKHSNNVKKNVEFQEKLEKAKNKAMLQDYANTFGEISNLFKEGSVVGKAFAVAQATMTAYQAVANAFATAQNSPIAEVNPAYPYIRAGLAGAFGFAQVAKVAGVKFEKGGSLSMLDGKSHAQGGEDIHIGGKYVGEMEGGELFGVMSRTASEKFLEFNNKYTNGSPQDSFFENGGIASISTSSAVSNVQSNVNFDVLAEKIGAIVNDIKIVNNVLDTNEVLSDYNSVKNIASI